MASLDSTLPSKFKAVAMTDLNKLEQQELALPALEPNDVLVEVHASSLNPVDYKLLAYNFFKLKLPAILGCDVAGVIRAVGKNVTGWKVGDEIFTSSDLSRPGSFAEYQALDADTLVSKPASLSFVEAATLPVVALSAWEGIHDEAKLKAGEWLYVPGGAGGVGHLAVQIGKALGAKVITSASKPEGLALCKKLGADVVFNYKTEDPLEAVRKATGGKLADVVYDCTDQKDSPSTQAVAEGGRWCILGYLPADDSAPVQALKKKNAKVVNAFLGLFSFSRRDERKEKVGGSLAKIAALVKEGKIKPEVTDVVPFSVDGIQGGFKKMHAGIIGKIGVRVR